MSIFSTSLLLPLILFSLLPTTLCLPPLSHPQRWIFGLLSSFTIGLVGFIAALALVYLSNLLKNSLFKLCIKFFFSLACGTLLGDAFIHILSEAYGNEQLNDYVTSLVLILAITSVLVLEKMFHKCGVAHQHWHDEGEEHGHGNGNHHKLEEEKQKSEGDENNVPMGLEQQVDQDNHHKPDIGLQHPPSSKTIQSDIVNTQILPLPQPSPPSTSCLTAWKNKGSAGYLNLFGSALHNIIDGLSIGLAFSTGHSSIYIPVLVAISAHEIPRQLGDVAILLSNKFISYQVILTNGLFNLLALIGTIIGLSISTLKNETKMYIMVFVAGNFIYISSDIWRHLGKGGWKSNVMEVVGFGIGVGVMFGIKMLEEMEEGVWREGEE